MQEIIKSKDNEKIKFLKKLKNKKYRDLHSQFFVENFKIIQDAFKSGIKYESLFVTKLFLDKNIEKLELLGIKDYYLIDDKINKYFSDLNTPSGVCAIYKKPIKEINLTQNILYLNSINDPGNLGNILRSALAFGFENIILDENCVDLYNYKVINSAKDAIFKLNIEFDKDLNLMQKIKNKMKVFSTRLEESEGLEILKNEKYCCLVFGNEANGVDKRIIDLSDNFIKIKMNGKIESLNVANSASIILHYLYNLKK